MAEQQPIFSLKGFRFIVVQEIGIPSIYFFSLIDQSVMLNSPFLPPPPAVRRMIELAEFI